ncbi:MAG: hypothetical protein AB7R00_19855 [Kofleriaceae bacterium]
MTTRLLRHLTSALAVFAVTGCASDPCPPDDQACIAAQNGDDGKADGTNPSAGTGVLVIESQGDAPVTLFAQRSDRPKPPTRFEPGVPQTVSPGAYCVWTRLPGAEPFETQKDCTVVVEREQTVTYKLGSVRFVRSRADLIWGIDFPLEQSRRTAAANGLLRRTDTVAHAAGDAVYGFGLTGSRLEFHVDQGESIDVDLTMTTAPTIRLLPSTGRLLPNLPQDYANYLRYCVNRYNCQPYSVADQPLMFVQARPNESLSLRNNIEDGGTPVMSFPSEVQLRRIDLEHVEVQMPTGIETAMGRARVDLIDGQTVIPLSDGLPTGYGLDVPPGKYRVTTKFMHPADQALTTIVTDLDLQ